MNIRFARILFVAMFLSFVALPSDANVIPEFKFLKSVEGLLLKPIGYKPEGIYYYTKINADQTVRAFNAVTGTEFMTFNLPTYVGVTSLSLLSSGNKDPLFGCGGVVNSYIFDPTHNTTKQTFDDSIFMIGDMALSFDKKYFITTPIWYFISLRSIDVFDVGSGKKLKFVPIKGTFTSLDVATQSNYLAAGTEDNWVLLWPFPSEDVYTLNKHTGPVNGVSFSYNNQFLLSGSDDQTIILWNVKTREKLSVFNAGEKVKAVQWMPNDEYFAAVTSSSLMIWHVASKSRVHKIDLPKLEPNFDGTLLQFDSTGKYLAVQQKYSSNIQIWENSQ